jgi:hypothetical protein
VGFVRAACGVARLICNCSEELLLTERCQLLDVGREVEGNGWALCSARLCKTHGAFFMQS